MVESFARDVGRAARRLRREPAFALACVLTFALGIGAVTTVFGVVYAVLLRPLPFPAADRLIQIVQLMDPPANAPTRARARTGLSDEQFLALERHSRTLSAIGRYSSASATLTEIPLPVRLNGARVTARLLEGLGVAPLMGRLPTADDEQPGAAPVILLSHATWMRHFGGASNVIDQWAVLDGVRHRVMGVMPRDFGFPSVASPTQSRNSEGRLDETPEYWLPGIPFAPNARTGGFTLFAALAILREGFSVEQARAEAASLLPPLPNGRRPPIELVDARTEMGRRVRPVLAMFQVGVVLILLTACVNVTNLLLTRASQRRGDLAVRLALGSTRRRAMGEAVAESLLIAVIGSGLGCVLAYVFADLLRTVPPHVLPRAAQIRVDVVVLLFTLVLSIVAGVGVGAFAALRSIGATDPSHLHGRNEDGIGRSTRRRLRPSRGLVVLEIAMTLVLLIGSGLVIESFLRVVYVDPGFRPDGVLTFRLTLPRERYATTDVQEQFYEDLAGRLRGLPGVSAVAASNVPLHAASVSYYPLTVDGATLPNVGISVRHVTPDYFRALGIPLHEGRSFEPGDRAPVAGRVIVSDAFAKTYLPTGRRIGRSIGFSRWQALEIVGVVGDVRPTWLDQVRPTIYLPPDREAGLSGMAMFVRASDRPQILIPAVRTAIQQHDPRLALFDPTTLTQMIEHAAASPRLFGTIAFACSAIALTLAVVGLAGLLAYSVGSRAHEFGVRMALGAEPRSIRLSVVGEGVLVSAIGIVVGMAGAYWASRGLEALLYGVRPHEPSVLLGVPAVFLVMTGIVCYLSARRATAGNPLAALRSE